MSTVNYADELDFRLIFEEDGRHTAGPDASVRIPPSTTQTLAGQPFSQQVQGNPSCFLTTNNSQHVGHQPQGNARAFDCPSIEITSIAPNYHVEADISQEVLAVGGAEGGYPEASWSRDQLYLPLDPCYRDPVLCPSPCSSMSSRSWISDLSSCESFSHVYDDLDGELHNAACLALGSPLCSPLGSPGCGGGAFGVELWQQKYQHPSAYSPALSPHQSPRQSPCHSPRTSVTEDNWLHRRPTSRPSSRPTSPCGKRRHSSADPHGRSPSPHHSPSPTPGASPRGSVTDDTWVGSPGGTLEALLSSYQELNVPSKTRRTSGSQLGLLACQADPPLEPFLDCPREEGKGQDGLADLFIQVPSHFSWSKPNSGSTPLFSTSSPPPLDWPLPNRYKQFELKLEVQPKSYHRAHYETEGSRGSIKAASGGHPLIKLNGYSEQPVSLLLFIGTADDRYLRPHPFYQVHRVTGKTVTTNCLEKIMSCTKVLEIPLLPENNMSSSIDCAGILKLRNADIELKKGETDIGRKNTRVRVVFRVAVPQPDGLVLWLQTASVPVECSQRSGQELPHVESFSPPSGSVEGGEELIITGSNISVQSRVVFMEKGPDGRPLWEADARVLLGKSCSSSIVVEIPPYYKKTTCPLQVQFYVSNGKRRRSQSQSFTYLPGVRCHLPAVGEVKQESWEPDHITNNPPGLCPTPCHASSYQQVIGRDINYHDSRVLPAYCTSPSQNTRLPQSSSTPLQASLMVPHSSSIPSNIPSISAQTLIPPQGSTGSPQSSILPQITTLPSHTPLQVFTMTPLPSNSGAQKKQSQSLRASSTCVASVGRAVDTREVVSIKQEPQEKPKPGSLGFQDITLDDVNEIIDRDISSLSSKTEPNQFDQYGQYDWENSSGDTTRPFCGGTS